MRADAGPSRFIQGPASQVLCCGDLLDYGLFPEETLALLRERRVITIRGNHDRWAIQAGSDTSGWDLTPESVAYLKSMPIGWRRLIDGVRVVLAHTRPGSDMQGIASDTPARELMELLDEAGADILFVGHTRAPFIRRLEDGRIVANLGALLRDPAPGVKVLTPGTFAVLDVATREFAVRRAKDGVRIGLPTAVSRDGLSGCAVRQTGSHDQDEDVQRAPRCEVIEALGAS